MKKKSSETSSIFLLMLTALIWGVAFVAQSVGMNYVGPFTFNFVRFLIGALVLIPCIGILKKLENRNGGSKDLNLQTKRLHAGIAGGILCGFILFVSSSLQQFGIMKTTVGKAGFITALYIVIVPFFSIFLKKKVPPKIWIAALIAVAGMFLLCMEGKTGLSEGDTLVFLCAVGFSFHILAIDYFSPKTDGVFLSCIQFITAGVLSGIFAFLLEQPQWKDILRAWQPILYAGVMSCGVAYTLQIIGQKKVRPDVSSLVLSLESVFSVLAGWLILGQILTTRELFGCCLVFSAILLARKV